MAYGFTYTIPTVTGSHTSMPIVMKGADFPATAIDGTANAIDNGGGNLIAYTDDTKATRLALEVVSFVSSGTPSAEVWVKIPTVATGNSIYLEADDTQTVQPAVTTASYGRNAVWSDYEAVYHCNEDPSGSAPQITDSTGNGYNGTSSGTMTSGDSVSATVGNGLDFDGTDDFITTSTGNGAAVGTGDFTTSVWLSTTTTTLEVIGDTTINGAGSSYYLAVNATTGVPLINLGGNQLATTAVNDGAQHFLAATRTGTTLALAVNGVEELSTTSSASLVGDFNFGKYFTAGGFEFPGTIDEVRVAALFRSEAWLLVENNNQSSATAWGTVGTYASTGAAITSVGGDDIVLDAETPAFVTTGFSSEISTVQLVGNGSGTAITNGSSVSSTSGTGTFSLPDITLYTGDTVGCPLTTANNVVVARLTDA